MIDIETQSILDRIERLKAEHGSLDREIDEMSRSYRNDQLHVMRLKRRKLAIKDEIVLLESELYPDIIA